MQKIVLYSENEVVIKRLQNLYFGEKHTLVQGPLSACELLCTSEKIVSVILDCTNQELSVVKALIERFSKRWIRPIILIVNDNAAVTDISEHILITSIEQPDMELLFTINQSVRIIEQLIEREKVIVQPDLKINLNTYEAYFGRELVRLTASELKILSLLAKTPTISYSRQQIMAVLSEGMAKIDERTIDHAVKQIRKKMAVKLQWEIKTLYGIGYVFRLLQ
ncbi:MAG: winged helix-turn-helix domain-containing protein [Culicoidibacterales bacterium]